MRRFWRNIPLAIGATISGMAILLALIGPYVAPRDPMEAGDKVLRVDGEIIIPNRNPIPPLKMPDLFLLGTDDVGRDLYSRILFAFRPTLLLCLSVVAVRMGLGVPLGLATGWFGRSPGRLIDMAMGASLSIPTLVFAVAAISFMGSDKGLLAFVIALSVTGWADTALFVKNRTGLLAQSPFVESARSAGAPPGRILFRHILPQLWPVLPAIVSFELSGVLLLITELGFLGIYIGGGYVYEVAKGDSAGTWQMLTAGYPELGQMLSKVWAKILLVPWEPLIVGTIVFLMIFGFNMLGEGFRRHMDITRRHTAR